MRDTVALVATFATGLLIESANIPTALEMVEEIGFRKILEDKGNIDNFKRGLEILANIPIDPRCKAEARDNPNDPCKIRQCCYKKSFDLCCESAQTVSRCTIEN